MRLDFWVIAQKTAQRQILALQTLLRLLQRRPRISIMTVFPEHVPWPRALPQADRGLVHIHLENLLVLLGGFQLQIIRPLPQCLGLCLGLAPDLLFGSVVPISWGGLRVRKENLVVPCSIRGKHLRDVFRVRFLDPVLVPGS